MKLFPLLVLIGATYTIAYRKGVKDLYNKALKDLYNTTDTENK